MTISKNNKMMAHLNYKMKVTVQDSRTFIGYFKGSFNLFFQKMVTFDNFRLTLDIYVRKARKWVK